MQKDFHYYCVAVLARTAGFESQDALAIAYASQYTDNSTESEPIQVGEVLFDPVRTAHLGLGSYSWTIQKKIFIPFHFLPPGRITEEKGRYVTKPNSLFAQKVLTEAIAESNKKYRLCRMGIALHTFADTWAHEGFSGRQHRENDVEKIQIRKNGDWKRLLWENIFLDALPQIGHAEAGRFPDYPYREWKYLGRETEGKQKEVTRDNPGQFLIAAEEIFNWMRRALPDSVVALKSWDQIEDQIADKLSYSSEDLDERCDNWLEYIAREYPEIRREYSKLTWRNEALKPTDEAEVDWDDFEESDFKRLKYEMLPGFFDSFWVLFHRAALQQRHLVLENLRWFEG